MCAGLRCLIALRARLGQLQFYLMHASCPTAVVRDRSPPTIALAGGAHRSRVRPDGKQKPSFAPASRDNSTLADAASGAAQVQSCPIAGTSYCHDPSSNAVLIRLAGRRSPPGRTPTTAPPFVDALTLNKFAGWQATDAMVGVAVVSVVIATRRNLVSFSSTGRSQHPQERRDSRRHCYLCLDRDLHL